MQLWELVKRHRKGCFLHVLMLGLEVCRADGQEGSRDVKKRGTARAGWDPSTRTSVHGHPRESASLNQKNARENRKSREMVTMIADPCIAFTISGYYSKCLINNTTFNPIIALWDNYCSPLYP